LASGGDRRRVEGTSEVADIPGDLSTTASVTVGSTTNGTLETIGDHDWYKITLTAGQSITVTIDGVTLEDPFLYIRDSSGNVLFSNDDIVSGINRNSQLAFTADYTGTYYIDVGAFDATPGGPGDYAGDYQIVVSPYSPPPLATNDQIATQLTDSYWGGASERHHFNVTQGGTITVDISMLNAAEKALARAALAEWSDIIGVHFQEVTGTSAQIVFDNSEDPSDPGPIAATDANWSRGIITSAHVQISTSWVNRYTTSLDSYSFQTYIHEIGHALGLGHAGDYNGTARYPYDAEFQNDSWATSIMSYFDQNENTYFGAQGFTVDFAVTPMMADIIAMQTLYGLSTTTRTGDTTYGYNSNAGTIYNASAYPDVAYTIFDNGGIDTLDFSGTNATQQINLNAETFSNVNGERGNLAIARGTIIENAIGGSGSDTIIGNGVANVLMGRSGTDRLTGGAGNDTFKDTKAGLNGDTIVDFSAGDSIVFTDATLAGFTSSVSGHTLTYTGGSLTLTNVPAGTIVVSAAAGGGVKLALQVALHDADNDFNGDGKSDVLWRNDSGAFTDWLASASGTGGFASNDANAFQNVPTSWHVVGTGDFNGDGKDDIVWRNDNGSFTEWLANGNGSGGFSSNDANAFQNVPTSWHVAGTGDFNGDGKDDLIWRNDNGSFTEWLANANGTGGFSSNDANAFQNVPTSWHVVGTGDFSGDGKDDIIWRNDNGSFTEWLANATGSGGFLSNDANAWNVVPNSWHVVGTGDFNGDGRDDVLWRNDSGAFTEWLANSAGNGGFNSNDANAFANVPASWHVADVGDYNGDGKDDILWQNDSGATTDWLAKSDGSGGFTGNDANAFTNVPTSWHPQSPDSLWF